MKGVVNVVRKRDNSAIFEGTEQGRCNVVMSMMVLANFLLLLFRVPQFFYIDLSVYF